MNRAEQIFAVEVSAALRAMSAQERVAVLRVEPDLIHVVVAAVAPPARHRRRRKK